MEKKGYIRIEQGTGRNTLVYLTEMGKELSAKTAERIIEIENAIFHSWSKEEQNIFVELNKKYLEEFNERVKEMEILL